MRRRGSKGTSTLQPLVSLDPIGHLLYAEGRKDTARERARMLARLRNADSTTISKLAPRLPADLMFAAFFAPDRRAKSGKGTHSVQD